jgi:Domain of unknown function (DUF5615)
MIRFLADEDFDGRIVRGLFLRKSDLDLVRVPDVGLLGASDEKLLEWATDNNRIVLTHDNRTMPRHVRDIINAGLSIPGVIIVDDLASMGVCINDLLVIAECSEPEEWRDVVFYVPIK